MFNLYRDDVNCEGVSRRAFLRVGGLSLFGLNLAQALQMRAAEPQKPMNCILLFTAGGMANMDTLDMKPDSPVEYRGEFKPIETSLPGLQICEHLPLMARYMHKVCQVRSIAHTGSQHAEAMHFMLTGYPQVPDVNAAPVGSLIYPAIGSLVARQKGWQNGLPPNVQLSSGMAYSGAGYLGSAWNPLSVKSDPSAADFSVEDVTIPGTIGVDRTARRRRMLDRLDSWQKQTEAGLAKSASAVSGAEHIVQASAQASVLADRSAFYRQAFDLITSPAAKAAFKIEDEPAALRDKYGRNRGGQSTLLARRLVEAGVRFVTVEFGGWDTHVGNFVSLKKPLLPTLDQAWSALLEDLSQRGLLETTLVICAGEFGRTARVNGGAGRDHWPFANAIGLSGAGVKEGTIVGKTDARCEYVVGQQNSTLDYATTVFRILGIDDTQEYHTEDGRPVLVNNGGQPISGVIS